MPLTENKLVIICLVLGIFASVGSFLLGTVYAFIFLGIPAIAIGTISLFTISEQGGRERVFAIIVAIVGMIFWDFAINIFSFGDIETSKTKFSCMK